MRRRACLSSSLSPRAPPMLRTTAVANESGAGVTRLSLDYQIPIANAIITTENMEQAIARQSDKGTDAARVAVEMANLLDELS